MTEETATETTEAAPQEAPADPSAATVEPQEAAQNPPEAQADAPESYEFSMPEGVTLDTEALESATPILRELGLPQDKAQKLVDWYAGQISSLATKGEEAQQQALQQQSEQWFTQISQDPELGGANMENTRKQAQKFMSKFASPELTEFLVAHQLDNHPELVRMAARAGAAFSEDTILRGGAAQPKRSAAEILYGDN